MDDFFLPPNDLYEMELIGDLTMLAAVPIDAPERLKRYILAAIRAYHWGISLGYAEKQYGDDWKIPVPSGDRLFLLRTLRHVEQRVRYISKLLSDGSENLPQRMGLFAARAALLRLKATFRSASILIMQGYPFEAASMGRIILEQMAWAYIVYQLDDKDSILRVKAPKAIGRFKEILPEAGRIYGGLSEQTHLDPETNRHYISTEENGTVVVRYYLPDDAKLVLAYLLVLLKAYYDVTQTIIGPYIVEPKEERSDFIPNYKTNTEILDEALEQLRKELTETSYS